MSISYIWIFKTLDPFVKKHITSKENTKQDIALCGFFTIIFLIISLHYCEVVHFNRKTKQYRMPTVSFRLKNTDFNVLGKQQKVMDCYIPDFMMFIECIGKIFLSHQCIKRQQRKIWKHQYCLFVCGSPAWNWKNKKINGRKSRITVL